MELLTIKDFKTTKYKLSFAVVTQKNVVMAAGFTRYAEAKKFIKTAYFGYYNDCKVSLIKTA